MGNLVGDDGAVQPGLFKEPVTCINYLDYKLETPMGLPVPGALKKVKFNQFHFIGVMGPEIMAGLAVVDLKILANGFFYIYDRTRNIVIESKKLSPSGKNVSIELNPDHPMSFFYSRGLSIEINNDHVYAKAKDIALDFKMAAAPEIPLRLCTKAGYRGWVYTQKTTPVKINGYVEYKGEKKNLGSPSYMALTDWTAGFMRRNTFWNWASTAFTLKDGRSLGMNLSCGVNETGFTENAFWIDNEMTFVNPVNFIFDKNNLYSPWKIRSSDNRVNLDFYPKNHRGEKINAGFVASRFTQMMGVFRGWVVCETGEKIQLDDCPGWTEDHYAKW